jgi:WS/DGAT/MGAT family acyltransferase
MEAGRRLSAADAAWLGLDRPEHRMVVTAVLRLQTRLDVSTLRELVGERLLPRYPTLRLRVIRSRLPLLPPSWRPDLAFELDRQVRAGGDLDGEPALMRYVGELMARPLDPAHPPWSLTLVQLPGHSAVVARLHHCLADGIALAGVLLSLVDQQVAAAPAPAAPPSSGRTVGSVAGGVAAMAGSAVRTVGHVVAGQGEPSGPLRGRASVGRRAAWTPPQDLAPVRARARELGVSVNDVLLAAVAGGLRHWLGTHGAPPRDVRVMVPVDLRRGRPVSGRLGNRFGIVFVRLPVTVATPAARAAAVHVATSAAKRSAVAPASYALLSLVGVLPGWAQGLAARLLGRVATVIVTNVPGPRRSLSLGGVRLDSVVFWVPHIGRIGIGVSIFSYDGTVTLGVATNSSLPIEPVDLVAAITAELAG